MARGDDDRTSRSGAALAESAPPFIVPAARPDERSPAQYVLHNEVWILVVARDDDGFSRLEARLADLPDPRARILRVVDADDGLERLNERSFDLCFVLESGGEGMRFLRAARATEVPVPILMLTAEPRLEVDLEAMSLGAADFLDEHHLDEVLLERVIRYALARRRQAMSLIRLAHQDQLTGLANRSLLQDRLARALAGARRNNRLVAVMVLDLNGFKRVNDELGHATGDRLLCIVAERLQARLRETDTIARTGGDEFALVIENLARPEHAALVAQKLLDAVAPTIALGGRDIRLSASLGVALYPKDAAKPAELQRLADGAMYRAKREGGNVFRFASAQVERHVQRGALLASDLRRGLERGEFVLHYQPQVALAPARLGLAALPVWEHPELGSIAADRFLGIAESAGLSDALMAWLIDAALAQLTEWRALQLTRLHLALPLIGRRQLAWSDLAERLDRQTHRLGIPPQAIEIELDETRLLADLDADAAGVARLRAVGIRLALDAYGTGPTSLRAFHEGAIDTVKIDRVLLQGVPDDARRSAIVIALLELARQLGIRTVATGVERHDQVALLRRHGCAALQAFMRCPALPPRACKRWLDQAAVRRDRMPVKAAPADSPVAAAAGG